MTLSLLHALEAVGTYPDDGELGPDDWNAEHVLSMGSNFLLGRATAGDGPVEELSMSADFTITGGTLALTKSYGELDQPNTWLDTQTFGDGIGGLTVAIKGAAGNSRYINYYTGNSLRWQWGVSSGAESGSNAGSNAVLNSYDDSGAYIASPFSVDRRYGYCYANTLYLGDDLAVGDGGTGASTAAGARTNLGLVIGTDVAPMASWTQLTADYTLTSTTSEQQAFNNPTNGTLTLGTGVYEFECFLYLTTMNAASGNLAFDPVGAGTAVTDRWGQIASGIDSSSPLNAATHTGSASVTQQSVASIVTAGTGTGMVVHVRGMFRVSTAGTIIPSVTLVTANAAVVKAGSWFKCRRIGDSSDTYKGSWS